MRVRSDTERIEFQNWIVRVRPAQSPKAPLLLLLHGWTGDEDSMWVFVQNFPNDYWMLAPRAPYAAEQGGYTWRPPQTAGRGWPGMDDFRPAGEALIALVDAYAAESGLKVNSFDVMGFSQGAALTIALTLLYPERIRRAAVLSGFLPAGSEETLAKRPLSGRPIFVAHGTRDELVKVEYAHRIVEALEGGGAHVTFCEDEVGHKVSAACLRALEDFFRE